MSSGTSPQKTLFWSERKLLLCYQLLRMTEYQNLKLSDFLFPFQYPRSVKTSSWEAFRTLKCLLALKPIGVSAKEVQLDRRYFYEIDFMKGFAGDVLFSLDERKNSDLRQQFIPVPYEKLNKLIARENFRLIDNDGAGMFIDQDTTYFKADAAAPAFFMLDLKVNRKVLQRSYRRYLGQYRARKLSTNGKASALGYQFTHKLFNEFFKRLSYLQGESMIFRPSYRRNSNQQHHDEFTEVFEQQFPYEFTLWQEGKYDLKFYEYLLASELAQETQIDAFECMAQLSKTRSGSPKALRNWGLDNILLKPMIYLSRNIKMQRRQQKPAKEVIQIINVVESAFDMFEVYLNHDHAHPLNFKKSHKSGQVIYALARDGYIAEKGYDRTMEYINTDPRFKLFAKTTFTQQPLLDTDGEGYIVPAEQVQFVLIQPSDLG